MLQRFSEIDTSGMRIEVNEPDIRGYDVQDEHGNDVGEVQDMIYNTDTDRVDSAIIGRGWLSSLFGERSVIVPFDRMSVYPNDNMVRLDIDRNELENFPGWNNVSDDGLTDKIRDWWNNTRRAA